MIQLSALIGRDAMDVSTALVVGAVTGIGVTADRVTSVRIHGVAVDAAEVLSFDGDVVTYEPTGTVVGSALPTPTDPRGSMVLDRHGDGLGTITDMTITGDGVIDTIMLDDGHALHGSRLQVIGSYAAIVSVEPTAP